MSDVKWQERWHPLRREWVIIAAHRQDRPWSGKMLDHGGTAAPEYDPKCYLCPRNPRVSGIVNDDYRDVFVFDNDHPSVGPKAPRDVDGATGIYDATARIQARTCSTLTKLLVSL